MIRLVTKSRSPAFMLSLIAFLTTIVSFAMWWQRHDFSSSAFSLGLPITPALLVLLLPYTIAILLLEKKSALIPITACIVAPLLCDISIGGSWILDRSPIFGYPLFIVEGTTDNWFPSVNAAFALIALTLLGIGALALCFRKALVYTAPLAWTCGFIVLVGAPTSTAILSFQLGQSEPFPYHDPLAFLVTGSVMLCGAALMLTTSARSITTDASARLRAIIIVVVTGSTFALWYGMKATEIKQLESEVEISLQSAKDTLLTGVEDKAAATTRLVEHWKNLQWQFTESLFLNDSRLFLRDLPATYAIAVTDANGKILYAARRQQSFDADPTTKDTVDLSDNLDSEFIKLGQPLSPIAIKALQLRRGINGRPIDLGTDKTLSVLAQPQFINGVGVGCVILLVRTDQGLRKTLGSVVLDYTVELWFNKSLDYSRPARDGESPASRHFSRSVTFILRNTEYSLTVTPGSHVIEHNLTWQPRGALIVSWCVLILLSFALYNEKRAQTLLVDHQRTLNESLDLIGTLDQDGRYLTANEASYRIWGYTPDELLGRLFTDFVHPDDVSLTSEYLQSAQHGTQPLTLPIRFVHKDTDTIYMQGTTHWVAAQQKFYIDMRDVTEQHALEIERRHAEDTFRTGVEQAGCVVYEYFPESNAIRWVGSVEALTGYSAHELAAGGLAGWMRVIHQYDRDHAQLTLKHSLQNRRPHSMDYRLMHKDGSIVPVLDRGRVLIDDATGSPRVIGALLDLTAIRQQEAALRRSEERYRIIATQVGAVIIEHQAATARTQVHGPVEAMLGYAKEVIEQQNIDMHSLMIHPDDRDTVIAAEQAAERSLSSYYLEYRYRHRDGHYFYIASRGIYLPGPDGRADRSVVAITDITERKLAEQQLQQNQEHFRAAAEQAGQIVYEWIIDQHGTVLELRFDGAYEQALGYNADEFRNELLKSRFALVHPDDMPLLRNDASMRKGGAGYFQIEHRIRHHDGHYVYVENRGTIRPDASGSIRVVGMLLDISDRMDAEADRQQYTAQLHMLSEIARRVSTELSLRDLLTTLAQSMRELVDAAASSASVNDTAEPDEHIAATSFNQPSTDTTQRAKPLNSNRLHTLVYQSGSAVCLSREYIATNEQWRVLTEDDGIHHPIHGWLAAPLIGRDGVIMGILEVSDKTDGDFTDSDLQLLKQLAGLASVAIENIRLYSTLEERVTARTRELEISNRELEAFSYSVSHDLRAPLRAIGGFSTILEQEYGSKLSGEGRRYLQRIINGVERMANLIDDLLSLARVSRADLTREPVDITALSRGIVKRHKERWPNRKLDITIDTRMRATADPRLVEVALENLIENALKFSSTRDETLVHIGRRNIEGKPAFFVRDNGVGFDQQYATNLFGVFQRMHSNTEFPGTGVGLATVHRIVQRHRGRTWAESTLNEGATFYFTLDGA